MEAVELIAVLACTLFSGASIYINLVEHPARLSCGTEIAARQWAPSYKRATVMQVLLALIATAAGLTRGAAGGGVIWFAGALLIFAVIPFTALVVLPTNNRLLEPGRDRASEDTRRLLERWGRLHAVRSALSLAASVTYGVGGRLGHWPPRVFAFGIETPLRPSPEMRLRVCPLSNHDR